MLIIMNNLGQNNLTIGGIAVNCGSNPKISPSCGGGPGPQSNNVTWDHMSVPDKWHLILSNGFSRVHECDRRHTDRRTAGWLGAWD